MIFRARCFAAAGSLFVTGVLSGLGSLMPAFKVITALTAFIWFLLSSPGRSQPAAPEDPLPALTRAETVSPLDGARQPILYWAPESAATTKTPLLVFLHSWSADFSQDNSKWLRPCIRHGWIWVHPDFRGVNQTPKACGSRFARQDILDAVDFARQQWEVDPARIYLAGVSGGGHMSLLMAGHHPDRFSAVSAWVGPTDLAEWYRFHNPSGSPGKYAQMIASSLGGPPGFSGEVDADYRDRSPVFHLHLSGSLPVSIMTGVEDGHTGSVPVSHSLEAYNAIARGHGDPVISEAEIEQLVRKKSLERPQAGDTADYPHLERAIHLHRRSGHSEVTVFAGGHESLPDAAFHWLAQQRRTAAPAE